MRALAMLLVGLAAAHQASCTQVWAEYAQSVPTLALTATTAYQFKIFGSGTTGLYDYLHLTAAQALTVRRQLFDFMVSVGLGVDEALYQDTDPAQKMFVDLEHSSADASGFKLKPTVATVESLGYIGPYYRNKTRYPSAVYPKTGDPDIDSHVYSFFEAGYSLVTINPIELPLVGNLDLGSSILNAVIRFINLNAPEGKQAFELRTPLLRTPQPGITVNGAALPTDLDDGVNSLGSGEVLVTSAGTKVDVSRWVDHNYAYFSFPSLAGTGYNVSTLTEGIYPPFSVAEYDPAFADAAL